jgi:hypothetical protein
MNKPTSFTRWLDTLVSEKGLDTEHRFSKQGASGENSIPLGCVIESIKGAPSHEQAAIKNVLVKIDFKNGNVMHFFDHLAGALAI